MIVVGAGLALIPGAALVLTQVLNAVLLLLPLLGFMYGIARDRKLMGEHAAGPTAAAGYLIAIVAIAVCTVALFVYSVK